MILLFIGPPGSGKDTQAEILEQTKGFKVISTGGVMREEIAKGTDLGKQARAISSTGGLLPDEMMYQMLEDYLRDAETENIILTGVVRRVGQITLLDALLQRLSKQLDRVMYFDLSDEAVVERLSRRWYHPQSGQTYDLLHKPPPEEIKEELVQREDDKPESIRVRLKLFHDENDQILAVYEARDLLVRIDASPSVDAVSDVVIKLLS